MDLDKGYGTRADDMGDDSIDMVSLEIDMV